jgi:hypothetical protein
MKEFDDSFPPPLAMEVKRFRTARFDYQYERNGTANLFMMFAPLEGWRQESRPRKSGQDDRWSFCLTAGTLCPTNQETR